MSSNSRALHKGAIFWAATICSVFRSDNLLNTEESAFAFFLQISQLLNKKDTTSWQFVGLAGQMQSLWDNIRNMGTTIAKADGKKHSARARFSS